MKKTLHGHSYGIFGFFHFSCHLFPEFDLNIRKRWIINPIRQLIGIGLKIIQLVNVIRGKYILEVLPSRALAAEKLIDFRWVQWQNA